MTSGEASIDVWDLCGSLAELILTAGIRPPHGERTLARTVVSLALHAAIRDRAAARPSRKASAVADDLPIRQLADQLHSRPRHELFAALPLSQLGEQDRTRVDALRLMAYRAPGLATITLERLVEEARTALLRAADALPSREPTLGMLRNRLPQ
ncbi:hypothetical protein ABZ419_30900 [Streptomyces cinnamoneus]|uniref:hypothetical protein n=1 Tax=Streptomyces cinnamoneus TaxID=53446 RepID=UPI003400D08F